MIVVIALIGAAEGKEVIAFQHGDIVAEELVLTIPKPGADALGVHVIWRENGGAFAERLQGAAKLRELRRTTGGVPGPVIAQITKMEIVSGVRSNVGGQARHEVPRLLRTVRLGSGLAQGVTREEAADIGLAAGRSLQSVEAVTAGEVPFRAKVMVEASDTKM